MMASCLLPTIQILQPSTTNPVLRPEITLRKSQSQAQSQRRKKSYCIGSGPSKFTKMRLSALRNSALLSSLIGLSSTQSTTSSWGEPFNVDVSTESLLGSSQQPLTNIVGTNTPATTGLAPIAPITGEFSTTVPTELSTVSSSTATAVVTVSSSESGGIASSSSSHSSSHSASASGSVTNSVTSSRASGSGTGPATQSTAAAAPMGIQGQQKIMGVAGALAGAAGVLFV